MSLAKLAVLVAVLVTAAHSACMAGPYDLSGVPTASIFMPQIYNGQPGNYTWTINLCNTISPSGGCAQNGPGYIAENQPPPTGSCETTWNTGPSIVTIGNVATLTYGQTASSNHPGWTAKVVLKCGGGTALTPTVAEVDVSGSDASKLNFNFQLQTSAMCGSHGSGSGSYQISVTVTAACSGGCVFLIIYFLGIGGYVIGGVCWNHFKQGKTGSDLVPHKEFWMDFPYLLKDGLFFLIHKIKSLFGKGDAPADGTYQQM